MKSSISPLVTLLAVWAGTVALAALLHLTGSLPRPAIPAMAVLLSVAFSFATVRIGSLASALRAVSIKGLVGFNVARLVGFSFIWLGQHGRLPQVFAERAGWGDIAAAVMAAALVLVPEGPLFRRLAIVWSVFGLADLVDAVGTGIWVTASHPAALAPMSAFPMILIPWWAVPVLIAIHLEILRRVATKEPASRTVYQTA